MTPTTRPAVDGRQDVDIGTDDRSRDVRQAWDGIAEGFDAVSTPPNMTLAERVLRRARLRPGARVLDVAAGTGALSIPAARLGADVVAVDLAPAMVERLHARAKEEGLANLQARVMDGQDLDLDDASFDLAASQFGVMLFPDLARGFAEMVRVTKPGGKVLVVVMGPPAETEFLQVFVGALEKAVPGFSGLPEDPPPLPFRLADPEVLTRRLADAGLRDIRVHADDHALPFRSAAHMWDWITTSNPIGAAMVADLTEDQREAAMDVLEYQLVQRTNGGGTAVLHNRVYTGLGTKS